MDTPHPHPKLSRNRARVRKEEDHIWCSLSKNSLAHPMTFRWERVRVRAISFSVGERKLMNHFVVRSAPALFKYLKNLRRDAGLRDSPKLMYAGLCSKGITLGAARGRQRGLA